MSTPTLLESIQHVFIRKVAVNSGGKHCLALSSEGEVYSWGEAEDGKLGHGNRRYWAARSSGLRALSVSALPSAQRPPRLLRGAPGDKFMNSVCGLVCLTPQLGEQFSVCFY